jgi:hypothetical protein
MDEKSQKITKSRLVEVFNFSLNPGESLVEASSAALAGPLKIDKPAPTKAGVIVPIEAGSLALVVVVWALASTKSSNLVGRA